MGGLYGMLIEAAQGTLTSLPTLQTLAGMSRQEAARYCGIPLATWRRYLYGRPTPRPVLQLMTILAGYVPWPGWEHFYHCAQDGRLYHRTLKDGFQPQDILQIHWLRKENTALRLTLEHLKEKTMEVSYDVKPTIDEHWMVRLISNGETLKVIRYETEEEARAGGEEWLRSCHRMELYEQSLEFAEWKARYEASRVPPESAPATGAPHRLATAGRPPVPGSKAGTAGPHTAPDVTSPVDQEARLEAAQSLEKDNSLLTYPYYRQAQGGAAARRPPGPVTSPGVSPESNNRSIHYAQSWTMTCRGNTGFEPYLSRTVVRTAF